MSGYDFEAMYVVRHVQTIDGLTYVIATLDADGSNRVAVCASADTVYGWEDVGGVAVHFTVTRQPNHLAVGDVVRVQSSHKPAIRLPVA